MLRIWGRLNSINVMKVVWAVRETGVPFERVDAGRQFGIVDTPDYQAMNPNGLIPLLDDNGFLLWESNVIVRYLAARYAAGTLYPEDLQTRFTAERWMDWQQTRLNPATKGSFWQWIRTPEAERQPAQIEASNAVTEPLMAIVDAHLARHRYMAGEQFTMADIPIACEIHRWSNLPQPQVERPHIARWYAEMRARPAARELLDAPLS
ncbi:MAG TPA: glutathione S-transferase [Burkholderiaceae bacterium]|jgi:glutathione S-transferase|nr:glutathione S-transferase [Burkholderiaceae bacterium]